ncbi:P3 protein-like protein, partial [Dinothrombium tinctorium]
SDLKSLVSGKYQISVTSDNEKAAKIDGNNTVEMDESEVFAKNFTFTVKGVILGKANIIIRLKRQKYSEWIQVREKTLKVAVLRVKNPLHQYFTIFVGILVCINNINIGCILDLKVIRDVLRRPIAPIIGFLCQFLFMPLASFGLGKVFFAHNNAWKLGLFVLGCSPGGIGSNFWTLLVDGDVNLSVTMTFFSTVAALGMMPLWLFLLGKKVVDNPNFVIPYLNMIISLLALTIPIVIGLLIQRYKPKWGEISKKILHPFTVILLIVIILGGLYTHFYIIQLFEWIVIFAGSSVVWGGFLFGALVSILFQLPRKQVIAVSIETALQNPAVAFVLLQTSIAEPDADLAAIPIVGQMVVTGPPLWTLYILTLIFK